MKAPWTDFKGKDIHEGDTIMHPDGTKGIVWFDKYNKSGKPEDQRVVEYDRNICSSRLCLQIGEWGMAEVMV